MTDPLPPVELSVRCERAFLPVVLNVVEGGSRALGAGEKEALRLVLATEEIFTHLIGVLPPETRVTLRCATGVYNFSVELAVPVENIDLGAFNITASVFPESEASLEEMGLLIAARSVDSLLVEKGADGGVIFRIVKEREYPESGSIPEVRLPEDSGALTVRDATPESLKLFTYLLLRYVPSNRYPAAFRYPGKVADMVKSGTYGALVAQDATGAVGGGILWHLLSPEMAECFGPYCFMKERREETIRALLDGVLGKIARSSVLGLINRYHPEEIPPGYFEELGTIRDYSGGEKGKEYPYFFRMMREDLGAKVWVHPDVEPFLRETTRRLFLPREILPVHDEGEHRPAHSVISARFEPPARRATLRPLWPGQDVAENLSRHVAALTAEKIVNLLFEVDLGISEHALWIPALLSQNFAPKVILPYAGKGDLLLFQYDAASA